VKMNLRDLRTWHGEVDVTDSVEFEADGEVKPKWIQIMPFGEPQMNDQQRLRVTEEDMRALEADLSKKTDKRIPILFRHGKDPVKGGEAGGWFLNFERRADGLYGLVEWTKNTAQEIKNKVWRFLSPGFWGREDGEGFIRPSSIYEVSLTNIPAIHGMKPAEAEAQLNHTSSSKNEDFKEEQQMDLKEIALSLGLDEAADASQVKAKIEALKASDAKRTEMENAAIEAAKPKVYTFTQEQFDAEITKRAEEKAAAELEAKTKAAKVVALMEAGAKLGSITPDNKDALQKVAEQFPVEFESVILPNLKVVTPVGSKVERDGSAERAVNLETAFNTDELDTNAARVAKQFGMSIADAKSALIAGRITVKK
jgi:phage I-like protein